MRIIINNYSILSHSVLFFDCTIKRIDRIKNSEIIYNEKNYCTHYIIMTIIMIKIIMTWKKKKKEKKDKKK